MDLLEFLAALGVNIENAFTLAPFVIGLVSFFTTRIRADVFKLGQLRIKVGTVLAAVFSILAGYVGQFSAADPAGQAHGAALGAALLIFLISVGIYDTINNWVKKQLSADQGAGHAAG